MDDKLPTFKGDFTPYWEDGAASTAAEFSINRYNGERLNQLEILWSITDPQELSCRKFLQRLAECSAVLRTYLGCICQRAGA